MQAWLHVCVSPPGSGSRSHAPAGVQQSTAEVEDELLALWSSVEKDKAAVRERLTAAAGLARRKGRRGPRRAAGDGAAVRWRLWNTRRGGRWQQLQACAMPVTAFPLSCLGLGFAAGSFQRGVGARKFCMSAPASLRECIAAPA